MTMTRVERSEHAEDGIATNLRLRRQRSYDSGGEEEEASGQVRVGAAVVLEGSCQGLRLGCFLNGIMTFVTQFAR